MEIGQIHSRPHGSKFCSNRMLTSEKHRPRLCGTVHKLRQDRRRQPPPRRQSIFFHPQPSGSFALHDPIARLSEEAMKTANREPTQVSRIDNPRWLVIETSG